MSTASSNVRVREESGKHVLLLSSSHFDPTETWGPDQLLRPVVCYFSLAARSQSARLKHCTRHVLGGVKCDDVCSSHFSAARRSHGRSPLPHSSQRYT